MDKRRAIEFLGYLLRDKNIERTIYEDALKIAIESLKAQLSQEDTTKDAISRQAAIDAAKDWYEGLICGSVNGLIKKLKALPPVQPETAKRIVGKSRDGMTLWYQCDMCNEPVDAQDDYCRGCGRRLIDG